MVYIKVKRIHDTTQSMGFNCTPLHISRIIFLFNPLVMGSTKFLLDLCIFQGNNTQFQQLFKCTISDANMSFLLLLLYTLFYSIPITACESQWRESGEACLPHKGISAKRFLSHWASYPANSRAMNSYSMVECAIQVCFEDFHEIAPAPKVST